VEPHRRRGASREPPRAGFQCNTESLVASDPTETQPTCPTCAVHKAWVHPHSVGAKNAIVQRMLHVAAALPPAQRSSQRWPGRAPLVHLGDTRQRQRYVRPEPLVGQRAAIRRGKRRRRRATVNQRAQLSPPCPLRRCRLAAPSTSRRAWGRRHPGLPCEARARASAPPHADYLVDYPVDAGGVGRLGRAWRARAPRRARLLPRPLRSFGDRLCCQALRLDALWQPWWSPSLQRAAATTVSQRSRTSGGAQRGCADGHTSDFMA
jgi:hypothetical protein